MPQVDLEALVSACAGGCSCDNRVACETLAREELPPEYDLDSHSGVLGQTPPDFPPESFRLSKDAEFDWFDRNAFYERKDSTKGNSNSGNLNPSSNSSSQRFSVTLKSKAPIIGLPRTQKTCFVDPTKIRRNGKQGKTRLFPKRSGSTGKSDPPVVEPSSPKVSCMGRVRSKKDRSRRLRSRQPSNSMSNDSATVKAKPAGRRKAGLFSSFRSMFRSGRESSLSRTESERRRSPPRRSSVSAVSITRDIRERLPAREIETPSSESLTRRSVTEGEPPGLGGMMLFASGRRSDAWVNDVA